MDNGITAWVVVCFASEMMIYGSCLFKVMWKTLIIQFLIELIREECIYSVVRDIGAHLKQFCLFNIIIYSDRI